MKYLLLALAIVANAAFGQTQVGTSGEGYPIYQSTVASTASYSERETWFKSQTLFNEMGDDVKVWVKWSDGMYSRGYKMTSGLYLARDLNGNTVAYSNFWSYNSTNNRCVPQAVASSLYPEYTPSSGEDNGWSWIVSDDGFPPIECGWVIN